MVSIDDIIDYVIARHDGVVVGHNWGERGLFYNPGNQLPKGVYILTFKEKDGLNDKASYVDRSGVYRLNLGISRATFVQMFGAIPKRPAAGRTVATGHDFQKLAEIMPHPVYGWMAWIAVLNPSPSTFEALRPLIEEGVALARQKFNSRAK